MAFESICERCHGSGVFYSEPARRNTACGMCGGSGILVANKNMSIEVEARARRAAAKRAAAIAVLQGDVKPVVEATLSDLAQAMRDEGRIEDAVACERVIAIVNQFDAIKL